MCSSGPSSSSAERAEEKQRQGYRKWLPIGKCKNAGCKKRTQGITNIFSRPVCRHLQMCSLAKLLSTPAPRLAPTTSSGKTSSKSVVFLVLLYCRVNTFLVFEKWSAREYYPCPCQCACYYISRVINFKKLLGVRKVSSHKKCLTSTNTLANNEYYVGLWHRS